MNKSTVSALSSPEFINLQPLDVNSGISNCEIKVLYLNENRNGSYITKEVAEKMGRTLRGAPIVGHYKSEKKDFHGHGEEVRITDDSFDIIDNTKPFGFVPLDAQVWFQDFEDQDVDGRTVVRTYLMTTGYLWTGQYPETKPCIEEGRPQSMKLNEENLEGHWAKIDNSGYEFFIINDAEILNLCILGNDVEPCFEGASVTAPNVSTNFELDTKYITNTLFTMMQELKIALEGGRKVENEFKNEDSTPVEVEEVETPAEFTEVQEGEATNEAMTEVEGTEVSSEDSSVDSDFSAKEDKKEEDSDEASEEEEDEDKKKKEEDYALDKEKYSLMEEELSSLKDKYSKLEADFNALTENYSKAEATINELKEYQSQAENTKKENLINEFSFLGEDIKNEYLGKIAEYSFDELEAKLSIIDSRNRRQQAETTKTETMTYSLNNDSKPLSDWVQQVKNLQSK